MRLAGRRLTKDGVLVIRAERFRTQEQNREDARDRLAELGAASDVCAAATHCDTTDTGLEGAPHRGEGQAEHDQAPAESQAGA
jgi:protein subunit release factor B